MKPRDDAKGYVFVDIPWRYSGIGARFLGLDPLVVLLIPLGIFGLRQGWGWLFLGMLLAILSLFVWTAIKGYPSVRVFLQSLWVMLVRRGKWKTR